MGHTRILRQDRGGDARTGTPRDHKPEQHILRRGPSASRLVRLAAISILAVTMAGCEQTIPGTPTAFGGAAVTTTAPVPGGVGKSTEIVARPEQAALMERLRRVDPCSILDADIAVEMGLGPRTALNEAGIQECKLVSGTGEQGEQAYLFNLTLAHVYDDAERGRNYAEQVAGRQVYRAAMSGLPGTPATPTAPSPAGSSPTGDRGDTCYYEIPIARSGYTSQLRLRRITPKGSTAAEEWPQRCDVLRDYLSRIIDRLERLDPGPAPVPEPRLYGKDPCAASDAVLARYPGFALTRTDRYTPYACVLTLHHPSPDVPYDMRVDINFSRNIDQQLGQRRQPIRIGGLTGQIEETSSSVMPKDYVPGESCHVVLALRPSSPGEEDGHQISYSTMWLPKPNVGMYGYPPVPAHACDALPDLGEAIVGAARR